MASIRERQGRFTAEIRRKGKDISCTFGSKESAELWAKYKEDLIDEMENFEVPVVELMSLETAIDLKLKDLIDNTKDKKSLGEINVLKNTFIDWLSWDLTKITYDLLMTKVNDMLGTHVKRGGAGGSTGRTTVQAPATVLRKLRVLSSVYSNVINKGLNIENIPLRVYSYLRTLLKGNDE